MARLEPRVLAILSELTRGLRALKIDFCIIGALVPELLLKIPPRQLTNDADAAVTLDTLAEFEKLKRRLGEFGFVSSGLHRLTHRNGGWVDLIPYSGALAPNGSIDLAPNVRFNMAGFDKIVPNAVSVPVAPGLEVPVIPLPLYALLKLVAFADRKQTKDLTGVLHCLRHYAEEDDRRYGLDHDGVPVPFEYTRAYLLGQDGNSLGDRAVLESIGPVLEEFESPDAPIVARVAREEGRFDFDDDQRAEIEISELFRWFRAGVGLV
jgi:predicted nucleotidyltransferase